MKLPNVWSTPQPNLIIDRFKLEANNDFVFNNYIPQDYKAYREKVLAELGEQMGFSIDHDLPLDVEVTGVIRRDGYRIEKLSYQAAKNRYVTACLYVPDGDGPFPAVLNVHGHHITGHLAERVQERGHVLARHGIVCLSVDAFGSGERSEKHGEFLFHGGHRGHLLYNVGKTLAGIQITDNMRGVDLLCSLPYVDKENLGVTGASGGGNQTMYVAAFDDRLKAAVSCVSVGSYRSLVMGHNCPCETIPNAFNICEEAGLISCIAPRAYMMLNAFYDQYETFLPAEMMETWKIARKAWEYAGVPENLSYRIFPTNHGYYEDALQAMLGFFLRHLKGVGHGDPKPFARDFAYMSQEEAMVYPKGKAPAKISGIQAYSCTVSEELKKERAALTPAEQKAGLEKTLNSYPVKITAVSGGSFEAGWEKVTMRTSHGFMIPALVKESKNGKWRILSGACGKKTLEKQAYLQESFDSEDGAVVFDVFASGERGEEYGRSTMLDYQNTSRTCLYYGWTMMGEWVREYTAIGNWLKEAKKAETITAYGFRDAGDAALLAGALYGGFEKIVLDTVPGTFDWSDKDVTDFLITTMAMTVPFILKYGDIPEIQALAAPAEVEWIGKTIFA
ncbi:MAG: hypothetical protein E7040_12515 [Lentisphaerae bacterium]|nr:hypothetical protein [Lentisphaerota bacterium]